MIQVPCETCQIELNPSKFPYHILIFKANWYPAYINKNVPLSSRTYIFKFKKLCLFRVTPPTILFVPKIPTLVHFIPIFTPGPLRWACFSYTVYVKKKSNDFSSLPTISLSHCIPKQTHIILRYMLCNINAVYINIRPRSNE